MQVINLQVKLYVSDNCDTDEVVQEMEYSFEHDEIQLTEIAEILYVKQADSNF